MTKGSAQLQTSSGQIITVELVPSVVGRRLTALMYMASIAAILVTHLPIVSKIALLVIVLFYVYRQEQHGKLRIRQLQIHPGQKILIRDAHRRTYSARLLRFERIICYYLIMRLEIENEGEKRIHIFADAVGTDMFRKLCAFAIQHRNRLTLVQ